VSRAIFDEKSWIREDPALHEECMRFKEILRRQRDIGVALAVQEI
jgi:hypothetical protein